MRVQRARPDLPPKNRTEHRVRESVQVREKGRGMSKRKRYAAEEIIAKLREAEVRLDQGDTVGQAVRKLGVSEQTYYRWRREYGGMRVGPGEAAEGAGARERAAEAAGRRAGAGQLDPA